MRSAKQDCPVVSGRNSSDSAACRKRIDRAPRQLGRIAAANSAASARVSRLNPADAVVEKKATKEKKLLLYRIVQLQVKNIRTHSAATSASIKMQVLTDKIKLTIKDNGVGFDAAKLKFGYGFSRIQRLTEAYNGSFSLKGRPGKGCLLEILL